MVLLSIDYTDWCTWIQYDSVTYFQSHWYLGSFWKLLFQLETLLVFTTFFCLCRDKQEEKNTGTWEAVDELMMSCVNTGQY